jgi:glc operon protein GlcG
MMLTLLCGSRLRLWPSGEQEFHVFAIAGACQARQNRAVENMEEAMKTRMIALAALSVSAFALGGVALAQSANSPFVVSGAAAEKLKDFTTINLATAEKIAQVCEREAEKQGVQISVMLLDNDGNQVYMDRMDGQGYLNIVTADMKARTALMGREPSKDRMNRVLEDPATEFQQIQLGFFPNSGGLPIVVNKQLIGAVGTGGSAPRPPVWSDEICAHRALREVIGASVPDLPKDEPRPARAPQKVPVPKFTATAAPKTTLPADWVVGGKGASNIYDGNQISLAAAKKVAKACRDLAASRNTAMSLYIIDTAGELVHMERMDGQNYNNTRTALLKAQTALRTRQPTSIRAAQLKNDPGGLPRSTFWYNFFSVAGGIPIVVDGQMIGAIGVGGGAGGGDENCAIEGLKAVFGNRVALPVYPQRANAAPRNG